MTDSAKPVKCAWCKKPVRKLLRDINRAAKRGGKMYCDRSCSSHARRNPNPPSEEDRRARKADYDRERRAKLGEVLLAEKRAAYREAVASNPDAIRERERRNRQARAEQHAEYCRTPEYRKWKAQYDRQYRAEKQFGPFAEAALTLLELQEEISSRATRTEIYATNGPLNKWTQRRREYERQTNRR